MNFKGITGDLIDPEGREVKARALIDMEDLTERYDFSDCYFHSLETIKCFSDINSTNTPDSLGLKLRFSGQAKRK